MPTVSVGRGFYGRYKPQADLLIFKMRTYARMQAGYLHQSRLKVTTRLQFPPGDQQHSWVRFF